MNLGFAKKILNEIKELAATQIFIVVILFIQVGIVTRQLGVEAFGRVSLLIVIVSFVFRSLNSRNSDVILIFLSKHKENVFTLSIFFDLFIGSIAYFICIILLISPLNYNFGNFTLNQTIHLFIFSRVIQGFSETAKAFFTFEKKFKKIAYCEFAAILLRFLYIIFFFVKNPTIENFLLSQVIFSISFGLISLIFSKTNIVNAKVSTKAFKSFLKVIKINYFKQRGDQLVGLIPQHFDLILLSIFTNFYTVGLYRVAKRSIEPINYIVNALTPVVQNRISLNNNKFEATNLVKSFLFPISICFALFYLIFGKFFISTIFGENFEQAYFQVLILLIGYLFYLNTFWIRHVLLLNEKINFHTISRLINTITFLLFSYIFSSIFPIYGIAISATIGVILQKIYEIKIFYNKI